MSAFSTSLSKEFPMTNVTYTQLNKDAAYWPEKISAGHKVLGGGHTAGIFTRFKNGQPAYSLLVDAGLGTIQALCDSGFAWGSALDVLLTHGHVDHHAELMVLSEIQCRRMTDKPLAPINVHCTHET